MIEVHITSAFCKSNNDVVVLYKEKPTTIHLMHVFTKENGSELDTTDTRLPHKIYLNDLRKCDVSKLKTVIRHSIKKIQ